MPAGSRWRWWWPGHGTARFGTGNSALRYLCLIAPDGEAVFVDVETA